VLRDSDGVIAGDHCSEIGTAASATAPNVVARRVLFPINCIFRILLSNLVASLLQELLSLVTRFSRMWFQRTEETEVLRGFKLKGVRLEA
jgi:hypothetical protein